MQAPLLLYNRHRFAKSSPKRGCGKRSLQQGGLCAVPFFVCRFPFPHQLLNIPLVQGKAVHDYVGQLTCCVRKSGELFLFVLCIICCTKLNYIQIIRYCDSDTVSQNKCPAFLSSNSLDLYISICPKKGAFL